MSKTIDLYPIPLFFQKHLRVLSLINYLIISLRAIFLTLNQSGFKTSHSTETALLCVMEALHTAKADTLSSVLILLDLSAEFNNVNHQILLSTLRGLGISGSAHSWIASYLACRS
jgi:hypothetical protein